MGNVARIAIAPCSKLPDYETSVRRAGGEPWVLDRSADRAADVVAAASGVLLAGGGDVLPTIYGDAPHAMFDAAEAGRDEYELELVRRALDADLPVFAICRGIQVLTVARGGTLVQDIPQQLGTHIEHVVREPPFALAHEVRIAQGSLLERLMHADLTRSAPQGLTQPAPQGSASGGSLAVNSRHHQAPNTLGEGLVVTAVAPDGVIEAVEDPSLRFCLGVQWHPENFWRTGEFRALFEGFVAACSRRRP